MAAPSPTETDITKLAKWLNKQSRAELKLLVASFELSEASNNNWSEAGLKSSSGPASFGALSAAAASVLA